MAADCPLNRKPARLRRWLAVLLILLLGVSFPFGVYWIAERTEARIRRTERLLMEELALLRAEVAALAREQQARQEALERLEAKTDALAELWQLQMDKLAAHQVIQVTNVAQEPGAGSGTALSSPVQSAGTAAGPAGDDQGAEEAGSPAAEKSFWAAWWAAAAYYTMKAGQYLPALYQLARLHPAVP